MNNVVPFSNNTLPAYLKAVAVGNELTANVGSGGFPVMSIKGKTFALVKGGERETLMNPNDPDEVATSIHVVILKANPSLSKVWYAKGYVEGSDAKPDCFSHDGVVPDPSVEHPQSKKCTTCPKNEWGSKITEDGKKGRACADSRRLAIANVDTLDNPILLRAPAATLKPLAEYGTELAKRNIPYNAVLTKIGFDSEASSPKLTFKAVGFLSEPQYAQVQAVLEEDVVTSILGKAGEAPMPEGEAASEPEAAPVEKPKAAKPVEKPKAAKPVEKPAAKVTEDEVAAIVEPEAKPKAAAKEAAGDALIDELDSLLNELDD